ncbi:Crp/Fnr family transcriptional regulator [Hyphomicrobium facile]|uniref:cAMP-binding domain of CRP or a regulatory subunit of cAMP-dependent protein kinases n=1 Tax=Hyphomicrobium facile TaxID=51670 RepID=A0A1I7MUS5_9HYPH|nr:Crp/Fnr family transcriptional regulator [Hyphomicrobium facile]SFV26135.1 cAMP-binding domain of CRP or a regulatory subunit of cAMP-dependent protein kinases [Hyphomicrobium facile]
MQNFDAAQDVSPSSPQGHALFLIDEQETVDDSLQLMGTLPESLRASLRRAGSVLRLKTGEPVFEQGQPHNGIFMIESGSVRTFYSGPSGKEITLAYWGEGHFVGGPELFGRGAHIWSAEAATPSVLYSVSGRALRALAAQNSILAMGLIDALIVKGRCYSSLAQILATKPARDRLAELLLALADRTGSAPIGQESEIPRDVTHEQLAAIIGSTRQWVTATLARFEREGLVSVRPDSIVILNRRGLREAHTAG